MHKLRGSINLGYEIMALEFMHKEMLKQLKKLSATNEVTDKYESAWSSATRNTGLPIPCPSCFIQGILSRLSPLKDEGFASSARCVNCKTKYEWQNPDGLS